MSQLKTKTLENSAKGVAALLRIFANEVRLLLLCKLIESREASVSELADHVGLTSPALSQHLSKMRSEGLVTFRRDGQTLWYRVEDPAVEEMLSTVCRLFCPRRNRFS
ncbi:ArsR/SmtB family transcription factor [Bradyrhizobium japonicum]|uniref:ArsR/SmtB family transcription factor n=1 Tax=Bradyrhizobium japonicum TaxID=375 RepID=UPI001BA92288|nr:metalloregulator ArsR/SmtB family transcription factor [Bradyrhizobium japonicum]MBR0764458.1 helix-turn-helix transcriptional regulator [Bradyrhizobium japonicum]